MVVTISGCARANSHAWSRTCELVGGEEKRREGNERKRKEEKPDKKCGLKIGEFSVGARFWGEFSDLLQVS